MKKISRTPEVPKTLSNTRSSRRTLNESMKKLFPHDVLIAPTNAKSAGIKLLSRPLAPHSSNPKAHTPDPKPHKSDRKSVNKENLGFSRTCPRSNLRLSEAHKGGEGQPLSDNTSPYKDALSPRATHTTIKKGQMPDFVIKALIDYSREFTSVGGVVVTAHCVVHEGKKAKFIIRGSSRAPGLCSKCAVKLAKEGYSVDEILLENEEVAKKAQLEEFLAGLNKVVDKYEQLERVKAAKLSEYVKISQRRVGCVETLFSQLRAILEVKKQFWVESVKGDVEGMVQDMDNYGRWLSDNKSELVLMKNDIKSNYSDIIEKVDKTKFMEILGHFSEKLREIDVCASETSIREPVPSEAIDIKTISAHFDNVVEKLLLNFSANNYPKPHQREKRPNARPDNFLISQSCSIKQQVADSGVSIDFNKVDADNIYYNFNIEKGFDSSLRLASETLLSQETLKGANSVLYNNVFK